MGRVLKDNIITFPNQVYLEKYISDSSIVQNTTLANLLDNQYNVAFGTNITTFKSDGTKNVGIKVTLNDVQMLDEIIAEVQLRTIEGDSPFIAIYETNSSEAKHDYVTVKSVSKREDFQFLNIEHVYTDYYSSKMVEVFIGYDVGQSGTFALREPLINHRSARAYLPTSKNLINSKKVFRLTKTGGVWGCDNGGSFLILDNGTVTNPYSAQLVLTYYEAFKGANPVLTITANEKFKANIVTYLKNNRDALTLFLSTYDGTGAKWSDIADGGQLIITAETNIYW